MSWPSVRGLAQNVQGLIQSPAPLNEGGRKEGPIHVTPWNNLKNTEVKVSVTKTHMVYNSVYMK